MDENTFRRLGSVWAVSQGLLSALMPERAAKLTARMVATNFENADELEPKPSYLRQTRALGVGLVAAGVAGLLLEAYGDDASETASE